MHTFACYHLPFEIMCNASDYAIGAVLGQLVDEKPIAIRYVRKSLADAHMHYTMMKKELLAVVYTFKKFIPYIWGVRLSSTQITQC